MTLRTKLVISFTLLLLIAVAAVGLIASRSIEGILLEQIDRRLVGFTARGPGGLPPGFGPDHEDQGQPLHRDLAEVLVDGDGEILFSVPSGFADDPDPLPDTSDLPEEAEPVFLPAVDSRLRYRAIVDQVPEGTRLPGGESLDRDVALVRAAPLTDVEAAGRELFRTVALTGAGVLLLGAAATWWTVKRSMRPVEQMVETAEAIAAGDLTRRVPAMEPGTELGRLGSSLNEMLSHVEDAVETEKEAQERLRQFVADASHELRTPVTAVAGYAELRRKGGLDTPEEKDKAWARIESEGKRMGSLVEDLLTLARLGQTTPLHVSEIDLARIARDAAEDHRVIDQEHPVTVTAPDRLLIEGDPERLHQVITNLLSNVRVHTPPWTKTEIRLLEEGETVLLQVTDDGGGFPERSIEHVFDRFYRADPSRSRKSGGSGLGLAIVEAIVSAHGGDVKASNVEGGALIAITLPRRQRD